MLYNNIIESGIIIYLVKLIKRCLNETCSRVGKQLCDIFPIKKGLVKEDA